MNRSGLRPVEWVERGVVDGRRIAPKNESSSAIPQQKEDVVPPLVDERRPAGQPATAAAHPIEKWLKNRYQPLR
jgi:hypothetical protein